MFPEADGMIMVLDYDAIASLTAILQSASWVWRTGLSRPEDAETLRCKQQLIEAICPFASGYPGRQ
jgi:hypothetical protein